MQDKLITPFVKATRDMDTYRQSTTNDYNSLKKQHPKVIKLLKKKVKPKQILIVLKVVMMNWDFYQIH